MLQGQHQVTRQLLSRRESTQSVHIDFFSLFAETSFYSPCVALPGGFSTGLVTVANGTLEANAINIYRFAIVNASEPLL